MYDQQTYSPVDMEDDEPARVIGRSRKTRNLATLVAGGCCCFFVLVWLAFTIVQTVLSWHYSSCPDAAVFEEDMEKYIIPRVHTIQTPRHQTSYWGDTSTVYAGLDNKTEVGHWREVKLWKTQYAYLVPGIDGPFIIAWQPWWNIFFGKRFYLKHCADLFPEYYLKQHYSWYWSHHSDQHEWDIEQGDKLVAKSKHVMLKAWEKTPGAWFPHLVVEWGAKVHDPGNVVIGEMAQDVSLLYNNWFTSQYISSWQVNNLDPSKIPTDVLSFLAALYDLDGLSYNQDD